MTTGKPVIASESLRLRRVTPDDAGLLERWQLPENSSPFNDFGLPAWSGLRQRIRETGLFSEERGTLIVEIAADGSPIGSVSWHTVQYGPNPESRAWNIGINLAPEARHQGYGTEAQRLLARHLFATTPAHRIEASTDVENTAEQRSLEKAGFQREGVLKGAQYRAGGWHDLVVYAVVRA